MKAELQHFLNLAQSKQKENKNFISKLKKKKPKDLDQVTNALHDKAFSFIDCLECANCCKSISPSIKDTDIQKLAKSLKIKPSELTSNYMNLDEDQDYVMNQSPCPFLDTDNYCMVYQNRPVACREYPHTNRRRMHQILNLTYKNTLICPAVGYVVEELKKIYE